MAVCTKRNAFGDLFEYTVFAETSIDSIVKAKIFFTYMVKVDAA